MLFRAKCASAKLLFRDLYAVLIVKEFVTNEYKSYITIDFLISENKKISPIEVKSSNYTTHSSLDKFKKKFSSKIENSYILYSKDVMIKDGIIHLPFYMALFL